MGIEYKSVNWLRIMVMLTIAPLLSSCDHVCLFSIRNDDDDTIFIPVQADHTQSPHFTVISIEPVSSSDVSPYILSDFLNKGFPIIKGKEEEVDFFVCPNAGNNVSFVDVSVISGHEMNTKYRLSYSRHSLTALWSKGRHARVFDVQPWAFPLSPLKCDVGSVTFSVRNLTDHSIYIVNFDPFKKQLYLREIRTGEEFERGRTIRIMKSLVPMGDDVGNDKPMKGECSLEKVIIVDMLHHKYISIEADALLNMESDIKLTTTVLIRARHVSPSHVDIEVL